MTSSKGTQQIGQQGRSSALAQGERPPGPVEIFKERLKTRGGAIALLTPRSVRREFSPQRIMVVAAQAYATMVLNTRSDAPLPDIDSTIDAVLRMAQLGLEAGTEQAYLVPYKGKIQPIVGPRGLIDLSMRHPKMKTCKARAVFPGDTFDYDLGDDMLTHRLGSDHSVSQAERAEQLEYVWAKYETVGGGRSIEVLTRKDVEHYRSFSAAKNAKEGPWVNNYEGMARKTALKRLLSYAPRDTFLSMALIESEDGAYSPGLSLEESRDALESGDVVSVPVPAALPQRQTAPAAEQIPQQGQSEPEGAPATRGYGDEAENFTR